MIVELGLILTVASLLLVIFCATRPRNTTILLIPLVSLLCSMLGLVALLQDPGIYGEPWPFTVVFILNTGLAMLSLGQIVERV